MPLTDDRLREIAIDAARSLSRSAQIGEITAPPGVTFGGEDAYDFDVQLDQDADREAAARLRIALRLAIRDRLLAEGDETYLYTRIVRRVAAACPTKLLDVARLRSRSTAPRS